MLRSTAPSNVPDALHLAGALVLLVRALEQHMRSGAMGDTYTWDAHCHGTPVGNPCHR
jgi:hypothetical protein